MKISFIAVLLLITNIVTGQKQITLEDIWELGTFRSKNLPGFTFMNDGKNYTQLEKNKIVSYDITTGKASEVILDGNDIKNIGGFDGNIESYEFSKDETKIIIHQNEESVYRHSTKADVYVFNRASKIISKVFDQGKISNPHLSPEGDKIGFVYSNNLYYKDLIKNTLTQISLDGKKNNIINGMCDWVYEEEFSFTRAFEWSVDGEKIAYIRFDESKVPEYTMPMYEDGVYPRNETFKYPKVGEKNADVNVLVYELKKGKSVEVPLGALEEMYIPRIKWTENAEDLCIFKLNRLQNHLQLLLYNTKDKKAKPFIEEKNKYYIDITDDYLFLKDKKHFIKTSEINGYNSIYLYNLKGEKIKQITESKYDVLSIIGVDEKKSIIYFKTAMESAIHHDIYSIKIDGKELTKITPNPGSNKVQFSSTFDFYVLTHNTINSPSEYAVHKQNGDLVRIIEDNKNLRLKQEEFGVKPFEFFQFTTSENVTLNASILKPADFDKNKKYPVLIFQYSGPGSQTVMDGWFGSDYWWYQMLAQKGYIVAAVDPRGTGARGEEFKKMTYLQLGKYETMDMIEFAKYLGNQSYVDKGRIGIFGWSYGGYMSSLAILKGSEYFKAAIAVAPVTNWKWYDSVYTERYMQTLQENEKGYKENSPVYFADRLKGNYLLVHGTGDDNVHFQNSAEMANALIHANKQFDTYYYPNKNHGIYGGKTRLHLYTKMTNFLMEKL